VGANGQKYFLAILEGLIPHDEGAWPFVLERAKLQTQRLGKSLPILADDQLTDFVRTLGHRTAETHLALCSRPNHPGFEPEPFTSAYQEELRGNIVRLTERIFDQLASNLTGLSRRAQALGQQILQARGLVLEGFEELVRRPVPALKIRIHGDYHLGQVLVAGKDVFLLDFEGEPARPLEERRRKASPWRDVAGMMRSFHYAAYSAWPEGALSEEQQAGLELWSEAWSGQMADGFLRHYLERAMGAPFVPEAEDIELLLRVFLMEKAVYELGYELNNRPDWAHIPMLGILRLLPGDLEA
jgi:maltose alpha-D-glucosyltransferase/alpha-amylase